MATEQDIRQMATRARLHLSGDELAGIVTLVDRTGNLAPEAEVVRQFTAGTLTSPMLTFFVPRMWRYRADHSSVPTDVWRAMFERAHYTEDMVVRRRPRRTRLAYRGATEQNKEGLSWSLDVDQARYFARFRQAPKVSTARVWVTRIPADRVFARYMDGSEKELTADVRGLQIYPLEEAYRLSRLPSLSRSPIGGGA
ncbi:hypothetical protein [Leifsonia sp. Le1]|uniref:hypothetical protein n=1 Tax=Leifsonia sp. Le1 TaxID=3404918 RepID=UPI003EBC7CE2